MELNGLTWLGTKDSWFEKYNTDEPETEGKCVAKNTFESASLSESYWQGKQTIPYLLMTTLKITFYENIKSVLVLVNHHFLI